VQQTIYGGELDLPLEWKGSRKIRVQIILFKLFNLLLINLCIHCFKNKKVKKRRKASIIDYDISKITYVDSLLINRLHMLTKISPLALQERLNVAPRTISETNRSALCGNF